MPHGLYLGSSLATQDRVSEFSSQSDDIDRLRVESLPHPPGTRTRATTMHYYRQMLHLMFKFFKLSDEDELLLENSEKDHSTWTNRPLSFVREHLNHGIVDVVLSLMGFAVAINCL